MYAAAGRKVGFYIVREPNFRDFLHLFFIQQRVKQLLGKRTHNHATRSVTNAPLKYVSLSMLETLTSLLRGLIINNSGSQERESMYSCLTVLFPYEANDFFKAPQ